MKTAIFVYGQYRDFDVVVKSWNFLNDLDCDVYFSTWDKSYQKNPQSFVDGLKRLHIDDDLGIQILGANKIKIKDTKSKTWSGLSLPLMSIGYETQLSPLQILNFYNAVANNGKMIQPLFVKEIRNKGTVVKTFSSKVIADSICSQATIAKAKIMLEEVVKTGTASHIQHAQYTIAGKTGTAQIANGNEGFDKKNYQASFCGYFPADKPRYSCIVVIYAPSKGAYYGASVACPVYKDIADKVYSLNVDMHDELKHYPDSTFAGNPVFKAGRSKPTNIVVKNLFLNSEVSTVGWNNQDLKTIDIPDTTVPNVIGMGVHADNGVMMTKPYAAGGAYISKMSNYCKGCFYDPKLRTGDNACPFTTLYWDFLDRNLEEFKGNHRMSQQLFGIGRLKDMPEVRQRAKAVLAGLDQGLI